MPSILSYPFSVFLLESDQNYADVAAHPFFFITSLLVHCLHGRLSWWGYTYTSLVSSVNGVSLAFSCCALVNLISKVSCMEVQLTHFLSYFSHCWDQTLDKKHLTEWRVGFGLHFQGCSPSWQEVTVAGAWGRWSHGIYGQEAGGRGLLFSSSSFLFVQRLGWVSSCQLT